MAKFFVALAASVGAALLTAGAFVVLLMMIAGLLVAGGQAKATNSDHFRVVPVWGHAKSVA